MNNNTDMIFKKNPYINLLTKCLNMNGLSKIHFLFIILFLLPPHSILELVVDEDMAKYGSKVLVPLVCGEAFEGQKIIWK